MKLKINFKQTRATSAADINSPNLLVVNALETHIWLLLMHNKFNHNAMKNNGNVRILFFGPVAITLLISYTHYKFL